MGDPAGIGPDVTLKAWAERKPFDLPPFYVIADSNVLVERARKVGAAIDFHVLDRSNNTDLSTWHDDVAEAFPNALSVMHLPVESGVIAGQPNSDNAVATVASIDRAVTDVKTGFASAVVTNPIAKDVLYKIGFKHPGHTEYLAALANDHWNTDARPVMMLTADEMRVVPVTIHVPLKDVPDALTGTLIIETVTTLIGDLKTSFGIAEPRVACTGLNPHAGENGNLGTEDEEIIVPAIQALRDAGADVDGPFPADTIFHAAARAPYDAIVAMYHDQALIPIKTLAFDRGVNVTLGLPFVRTSPDHGTAFDIAGTGDANPRSLIEAIRQAAAMVDARAQHAHA